ncbi:hypothetical protein JNM05_15340 [bacterium]|nr:hypothetical protein [bacterium]
MNRITWITAFFFALIIGCGGGGGGKEKLTLTEANDLFTAGTYGDALEAYADLISSEGAPAIAGAAWCAIRLHNYAQADSFFTAAGTVTLNADGYAGWSFANWALNNATDAITHANSALAASPTFTLSLDTRVTAAHLVWIQASSYLQLGNNTECFNKIKLLDTGYTMPTGTSFEIANALLLKLQSLGVAVAS